MFVGCQGKKMQRGKSMRETRRRRSSLEWSSGGGLREQWRQVSLDRKWNSRAGRQGERMSHGINNLEM